MTLKNSFTIDPFTDYVQYNSGLQALRNNGVEFEESIQTKAPYEFFLHLETDEKPLMMNYELMTSQQWRQAVTKVKPLVPNDQFLLYRRTEKVSTIYKELVNNDVFNEALGKRAIVFIGGNKETVRGYSDVLNGKLYPLGKYMNKFKLWICFDQNIKSLVPQSNILIDEMSSKVGELEKKINMGILRNKEKIIKYIRTPFYENGKLNQTSPVWPMWSKM